ncbi:MAG: hypothetical protein ABIW38_05215 [Ferruginibacter sp.]
MDNSFFAYLQQMEMIAFFSGYPLLYAVIHSIAGKDPLKNTFATRLKTLLPFAYALIGTLYLGLQLKNLYPGYTIENIQHSIHLPFLVLWALISLLFWIPAISKIKLFSLLHSLVFFFFVLRDLFLQLSSSAADKNILNTDMRIYSMSLLLNLTALAVILLFYVLVKQYKSRSNN